MGKSENFWEVIEGRQSVRKFKADPVPEEFVHKMLEAGVQAPNAHNRQSWRFVVLTDKTDMVTLAEDMGIDYRQALLAEGEPPEVVNARSEDRKNRLSGAPLAILVCVETAEMDSYTDENRHSGEYLMAMQSAALASGQILLAAHALGLGGVWMCAPFFAQERAKEALALPESWVPQVLLLIGYSDEEKRPKERKPLDEVVQHR